MTDNAMLEDDRTNEWRVIGPPGTGKTTFLTRNIESAVQRGRSPMVLSLTRAAAAEVAGRRTSLPKHMIGTLHSHCFRALGNPEVAEAKITEFNKDNPSFAVGEQQNEDVEDNAFERGSIKSDNDAYMAEYMMRRARMMRLKDQPNDAVRAWGSVWETWKQENDLVDFTDMIERCLDNVKRPPGGPDVIMADEAQDMDMVSMSLVRKWGREMQFFVVVGDPDQNLYQWRGSDPEAFTHPALPQERMRVLAQSYRVPKLVHQYAVNWIGHIPGREPIIYYPRTLTDDDASKGYTEEGSLRRLTHNASSGANQILDDVERKLSENKSVMILTTCGYMLFPLIKYLRERGIPFHNPYRTKHGGWNPLRYGVPRLVSYLKPQPDCGNEMWTMQDLDNFIDLIDTAKTPKILAHGAKKRVERLAKVKKGESHDPVLQAVLTDDGTVTMDFVLSLFSSDAHADRVWSGDVGFLKAYLQKKHERMINYPAEIYERFGYETLIAQPNVVVGTIHSVKGGQADIVYVFPDISLQSFQKGWIYPKSPEKDAIYRTFYVGFTRAREELVLCAPMNNVSVRF